MVFHGIHSVFKTVCYINAQPSASYSNCHPKILCDICSFCRLCGRLSTWYISYIFHWYFHRIFPNFCCQIQWRINRRIHLSALKRFWKLCVVLIKEIHRVVERGSHNWVTILIANYPFNKQFEVTRFCGQMFIVTNKISSTKAANLMATLEKISVYRPISFRKYWFKPNHKYAFMDLWLLKEVKRFKRCISCIS